jgi:glycosyltransferase involved in cell wall biosynthesis
MIDLTLGILTYNAPNTLENTLKSIFDKGTNLYFNEILLYVNPSQHTQRTEEIASSYNIKRFTADENKWIGPGFKWLVENSNSNNVLLLEDDFFLIEQDVNKVFEILKTAVDFLNKRETDVVRLRSRKSPGNPLYSSWFAGQEHRCMTHLAECTHWKENPDLDFPEYCKKISDNPVWYKFKSANANYTNNPCIFRKEFYKKYIIPNFCADRTDIETAATSWWTGQDFSVITGNGLFCHDRHDGK